MKVLVVGDRGFVAGYLLPALRDKLPTCSLYGMSRRAIDNPDTLVQHFAGDVATMSKVAEVVERVLPDVIINLSSISSVSQSWSEPVLCHQVNYMGVLNLCLAMVKHAPAAKLIHISSLEVYGGNENPSVCYSESSPVSPQSPYAVSKTASEFLVRQYGISHGLLYSILRPSNHTGPGRKPHYVLSGFAKQLAEIKQGLRQPVLYVGNLNVHRDFLDVRDVVQAYISILMSDQVDQQIFNICSGNSYSLSWLLDCMINTAGVDVEIKIDPDRYRPVDANYIRGSNSRVKNTIGWLPKIAIERTLQDLLAYWENRIRSQNRQSLLEMGN